jgi:hypothetical protein
MVRRHQTRNPEIFMMELPGSCSRRNAGNRLPIGNAFAL